MQLPRKQTAVSTKLAPFVDATAWLEPVPSRVEGFRNKVKLAVGGTIEAPTLGLNSPTSGAVDLRECPIQERSIWQIVPDVAGFITYAGLTPYDVVRRDGELKFVIVTTNSVGELLVRFVVRTEAGVERLRQTLPALVQRLPQIVAVSANLHPEHKAVVEGDVEVDLTARSTLDADVGDVVLRLGQRSFFQTNTAVAGALYRQAAAWADALMPHRVLDLYCGVGGFALHLASPDRVVHGLEIERSAIESARASAQELALTNVTFDVADADSSPIPSDDSRPDLVVVNPPRRGIGELAESLEGSGCDAVIYSSCNPTSLADDLARMPGYRVTAARMFDMFPHTDHAEVAVLLRRR